MTHDEKLEHVRHALRVFANEGYIEDEGPELLAWVNAAADALRLQQLGHHDRELLEFVQGERDTLRAALVEAINEWESWGNVTCTLLSKDRESLARIAELRKLTA